MSPKSSSHLTPERHPQRDFFIADLRDISAKDDLPSMEHPLFALKAGDHRIRRYERQGKSIEIQPGAKGLATIHDKDVWIYCISQLVHAIDRHRDDVSRTVRFTAHDFLVATQRATSGRDYLRLGDALSRLSGTRIETNCPATIKVRRQRQSGCVWASPLLQALRATARRYDCHCVFGLFLTCRVEHVGP